MKIVGIDLAINNTGLACWDSETNCYKVWLLTRDKKLRKNKEEVIVLEKEGFDKFLEIEDYVVKIVNGWFPDVIVLEDFSYGSKGRAVFEIGQVNGIVRKSLYKHGQLELIVPSEVKKAATGKGNVGKMEVMMSIFKKLDLDFSRFGKGAEHIYDAVAVIQAYKKRIKIVRKRL